MDVFEAIKKRRSVRSFIQREVEFEKIANILDAANDAPSAGNTQAWKFIVVYRDDTKQALARACPKQEWIAHAPVLIVITADTEKDEELYGPRGKTLYSIQNTAAAAQNLILAATAQGLGSTWVGSMSEEDVSSTLDIPAEARPLVIVALGYYEDAPVPLPKKRTEDVVYFHEWGTKESSFAAAHTAYHEYVSAALEKINNWLKK